MTRTVFAAALVVGLADAAPGRAQFCLGPVGPPVFGGGFAYGGGYGFGFGYHRHGFRVAGFAGGYYSRSVFVAPSIFPVAPVVSVVPFVPFPPAFAPFGPFPWGPGFGPGFWGPGFAPFGWGGFGPAFGGPRVVVVPRIVLAAGPADDDPAAPYREPPYARRPSAEPLPQSANPKDFLVIRPKRDFPEPGQIVPELTQVVAVAKPAKFAFDPFAELKPANVEVKDPDPVKEAARLVKLGRAAFAGGEYGRAGEHFDRAAKADPKAAAPHFLKAQAAFAAGGYADAVAAIRTGLDLDPAWPAGTFDPKEPYGVNAAAFAAHLADLRAVIAANPGEAALEFLLGYQLWFVGEKAEAKKWFAAAEKRLTAPGPIALFK